MIGQFLTSLGQFLLMLKNMFSKPENVKMYWKEYMHQCTEIGMGSIIIVLIISFFLGAVTTVQTAYQLVSPLVPPQTISQIVRDTLMLELSPTVLSIVLAGVVGSKIASELGNMRVSEQIDALEIMGINSTSYLIAPKIFACITVIPCLIVISLFCGVLGGRLAGASSGILATNIYDQGLTQKFVPYNVFFMLTKAYAFSFIVGSVGAFYGYNVKGGSLEIGRSSTKAVVVSCILILLADFILSATLL